MWESFVKYCCKAKCAHLKLSCDAMIQAGMKMNKESLWRLLAPLARVHLRRRELKNDIRNEARNASRKDIPQIGRKSFQVPS